MQDATFIQEYLPYLPALATLVVGAVASIIALTAIYSNRQISRKKNSLDTILTIKADENLRDCLAIIRKIHNNPNEQIEKYAYGGNSTTNEAKSIRYVINFYEYLAVGIENKVFDEPLLKESIYTTLTTVYTRCESFISTIRKDGHETAMCNFENLAKKWKKKPLRKLKKIN